MGDEVNIGGDSLNTWAAVRCPLWNGTGYRDQALPANENWSRVSLPYQFNSGYPKAVTPLMRAFPFIKPFSSGSYNSTSMNLGVRSFFTGVGASTTWFFYLSVGEGHATIYTSSPLVIFDEVFTGYGNYGPSPNTGTVGYDINSTRETLKDAVIEIELTLPAPIGVVTASVTLDSVKINELLPDNVTVSGGSYDPDSGVLFAQYTFTGPADLVPPFWSITSVTLA